MRVLLVEDDPRLAALIAEGLRDDGLMVDHAHKALGSQSFNLDLRANQ